MVVSDHVTPKGETIGTHWTRNWVDHIAHLNVVEDGKTSCSCQEFNPISHPACSLVHTSTRPTQFHNCLGAFEITDFLNYFHHTY